MTPRSRRYFAIKENAASLAAALRYIRRLADLSEPVPKHLLPPPWPGAAKLIDADSPESILRTGKMIPWAPGLRIFPEIPDREFRNNSAVVRQGLYDVVVTNAFTPNAQTIVKKIEP